MNFTDLININPLLSSLFGLGVLIWNYLFSYKISLKFYFIKNKTLNFVFFNILFYLIITPILLLLLLFQVEMLFIRVFLYLIILFQLYYFFLERRIKLNTFHFFNKFDYFIIFILILFTFPQITDADSLDYHLGSVLDIIRNGSLQIRNDDWYHYRLIGLGEMINFYGLFFFSINFGQIFQVLVFSNIILIFKIFSKNFKVNYLILFSFPLFASIMLSAKHILIVSNCYLLVFSIFLLKLNKSIKLTFILLILIIAPLGFKHSYLIYSLPIWFFLLLRYEVNMISFFQKSLFIFIFIPAVVFIKNIYHYGDPITPFLEFVKTNPNLDVISFAKELRYSTKVFTFFEFSFIPFFHFIPTNFNQISLLVSPIVLSFYLIFFKIKDKAIIGLLFTVYILLCFSGKSLSRFYLDLYFLCILFVLNNFNTFKIKKYFNYFLLTLIPYTLLSTFIIMYSIISLTYPILNKENFKKSMNAKAHNYEITNWLNYEINSKDKVLYDSTIRSKSYQNHKFNYYNINSKSINEIQKIIESNGIDRIVLNETKFNLIFHSFYKCNINNKKMLNLATRNPINSKKNIDNILILDTKCIRW